MSVTIRAMSALTNAFVASNPVQIQGDQISLDFTIVVTGGATQVRWYPEFAKADPNLAATGWFREVDEQDAGNGVVTHSKSIRSFQENGGANLANGTHRLTVILNRSHEFCRLQMDQVAGGGNASVQVDVVRGGVPYSP